MPDFTERMKEVIEELKSNPPACNHDWRLTVTNWGHLESLWYCTKCRRMERAVIRDNL